MGNSIGGKRRRARVMTVDGATYKYRPPAAAGDALRDHPGHHHLLESEEVRRLGVRARPLDPDAPLKPGKLYFLVDLPSLSSSSSSSSARRRPPPQRTWSGALQAGERLESLMLARRSASDVAASVLASPASSVEAVAGGGGGGGGGVRLRVRLPKADVQRLVKESRDAADAAEKIMQLCVARDQQRRHHRSAPATPLVVPVPVPVAPPLLPAISNSSAMSSSRKDFDDSKPAATGKKEKRARFVTVPDEIIGF
ncbi:uncharacterized protein At1g66480-like [Miscanthus floridulus]|uniref:uncharacterized protein At1g66480-like n=1 Tax=Miscanthus floridulus TaxID=154761 RepID=UPI00345886B0